MINTNSLLLKYNQPVPRYTSYPTVPFWNDQPNPGRWKQTFSDMFRVKNETEGISLYIHLPFCESLCIYCGCNKKITANHKVEEEYVRAIQKEWSMYTEMMESQPPVIREIHLGGGTPTFFSPRNLELILSSILKGAIVHPDHTFSIEGHPSNTSPAHLETLYRLGFRRISYGVQDLNPEVQQAIHRIQSFEDLRRATDAARKAGFTGINFDIVYGLPAQNAARLRHTIEQVLSLQPDRIAFYSYAHTPWINCSQRLIDEAQLPTASDKLDLYLLGKELFTNNGYANIGMDHFALPGDELFKAAGTGRLHRNFMGYTTQNSGLLIGLGVSAISDIGVAFAQNNKSLTGYYRSVNEGHLALAKNYFLTEEDLVFRQHILDIACRGYTRFDGRWAGVLQRYTLPRLRDLQKDGLVHLDDNGVSLTEAGRPFLRHCCKAFDLRLLRDEEARAENPTPCGKATLTAISKPLFSNAI